MYVKINFRFNMNKKYLYTIIAGMMIVNLSDAMKYSGYPKAVGNFTLQNKVNTNYSSNLRNNNQQNSTLQKSIQQKSIQQNSTPQNPQNSIQPNGVQQNGVQQKVITQNISSQKISEFSAYQKNTSENPSSKRSIVKKGDGYYNQTYGIFPSFIDPNIKYTVLLLSAVENLIAEHATYKYGDYLNQIGEGNITKLVNKISSGISHFDVEDRKHAREMIKNDVKMVVVYKQLENSEMGDDLDNLIRSSNSEAFLSHEDIVLKSSSLKKVLSDENSARAKFLIALHKDYVNAELSPSNAYMKLLTQYDPKICAIDNKLCINVGKPLSERYKTWADVSKLWLGTFAMYDMGSSQYEIVLEGIRYRTLISKGNLGDVINYLGFVFGRQFITELMQKSNKLGYTHIKDPESHIK